MGKGGKIADGRIFKGNCGRFFRGQTADGRILRAIVEDSSRSRLRKLRRQMCWKNILGNFGRFYGGETAAEKYLGQ